MTEPAIAEATMHALVDAKIFDRGLSYYRSGAVSAVIRRSDVFSADVHGSEFEPYRVEVSLHEGRLAHVDVCVRPANNTFAVVPLSAQPHRRASIARFVHVYEASNKRASESRR
jgi:hypothetical protein